jgi:hypothetical protein
LSDFTSLYDEPQEAAWFRTLHPWLKAAAEQPISAAQELPSVQKVLAYDRPDIVLLDRGVPILVVEETKEVPSGHNVGQRFGRLAAAAECGVPSVYFGPYAAKKHGGKTSGPRFMNLRLFHAVDAMIRTTNTAITTINWPVDEHYEVRHDREKDRNVRDYMAAFFEAYSGMGGAGVSRALLASDFYRRMLSERADFISTSVKKAAQYDDPPASVQFLPMNEWGRRHQNRLGELTTTREEAVVYNVGMRYIRSDPYAGMAMLYKYLYVIEQPTRALILWFPHIPVQDWKTATQRAMRKDIRIFRVAADAILFADELLTKADL